MTPENRELLSRLKAGDNAARRELYDRHHAKLRRYFLNWLSHRAEAEDCANEVFTLAWEGLAAGLEPRESIEQWLWGIARNVRSQRYQARGRELVGGDEVVAARLGDTGDDFDGFDDIDKDGKREAVRDAWEIIQALTPTGRAVLTLHLEATHRRGYEIKGAELSAELGERTWPRARVDRELNRAKDSVKLGMGVLAVARAASACPLAASIVARPDPHLRFADLSRATRTALAKHANTTQSACRRCGVVFRDAQRPGLYALGPGLMLLAAHATADDGEERRRALIVLADRAGILQRSLNRVVHAPGVGSAIQVVQENPMIARVVTGAAALIVVAVMAFGGGDLPPAGPTPSNSPESMPLAVAQPSPTPSAEPSPAASAESSVATAPERQEPSPRPSASTNPQDPVITLDGSRLSHTSIALAGVTGWLDPRQVHQIRLTPGAHTVIAHDATRVPITVDPQGRIGYDPALSYLSGQGTPTLTITGLQVTLDATATAYPSVGFAWVTGWLNRPVTHTLHLLPGKYSLVARDATPIPVTLGADGRFDFDPALSYLAGRGTAGLTVTGVRVTLDATPISYRSVGLAWVTGWIARDRVHELRLLPGRYFFVATGSAAVPFTVDSSGSVDYAATLSYLAGQGTARLTVTGIPLTIDATRLPVPQFGLADTAFWLECGTSQTLRLIPGGFRFITSPASVDFRFTVTAAGTFDYEDGLPGVDGRGTQVLAVG